MVHSAQHTVTSTVLHTCHHRGALSCPRRMDLDPGRFLVTLACRVRDYRLLCPTIKTAALARPMRGAAP